MAIKNTNLGGTDWTTGETLYSQDLNDTFDAAYDKITTLSAFWLNTDLYDVFEDFNSESTGAFTGNSNITVDNGSWTIYNTQDAGGATNELGFVSEDVSGGANLEIHTTGLTDNSHIWFRWYASRNNTGGSADYTENFQVKLESGGTYTNFMTMGPEADSEYGPVFGDILVVAKGSDVYDVYCGGKKIISSYTVTGTFSLYVKFSTSATNFDSTTFKMDDIRQSKGTIS